MLTGKKILLGITGSIAAYKSILLVRLLVKAGAEVRVVMTPSSRDFVTPLTLATLSKNNVLISLSEENTWANHVMLGRWADLMIVAPLSCNTLAKMANGICDNLFLATYLSATCSIVVAPAMDEDMWHHPTTIKNLALLESFGNRVISVNRGELASGLFGEGRMAEPEAIITFIEENIFRRANLAGKTALVTAGPTYESLDPVRFLGNHSSGKMGLEIAEALFREGCSVSLVAGPGVKVSRYEGITHFHVTSAKEMYEQCTNLFQTVDIAVMAAAVADYAPTEVASEKIKKSEDTLLVQLEKTKDILASLGLIKRASQLIVGFALETNNERNNALKKLNNKNADFIVLNSLKDEAAGFRKDTNKVTIFDREGNEYLFDAKSKALVAKDIVDLLIQNYDKT